MIPSLEDIKAPWKVLPTGIHDATLDQVEKYFTSNEDRKRLFEGLKRGVEALRKAGCTTVYLDGSFVTEKEIPSDFDACWDPTGVDHKKLDQVLLDFDDKRKKQKQKFGGEFFPSSAKADKRRNFVEFFQVDKHTGKPKGVIRINLQQSGKQ